MKMKVILIGGYPGVGKSTIMRKFIELAGRYSGVWEMVQDHGMPMLRKGDTIVLGSYLEDEKFPGTDRFSMAIQPLFEEFLLDPEYKNCAILLEGDRLFNGKTITFLWENKIHYEIVIVRADRAIIETRRINRSHQDEKWVKGRQTKIDNIRRQMPTHVVLWNNNKKDIEKGAERLLELIEDNDG